MTIPFYFLDGPLKGQVIEQENFHTLSYVKWTYGLLVQEGKNIMRLYCDVATCGGSPPAIERLPEEAYCNIVQEVVQGEFFEVDQELYKEMAVVPQGAYLKLVQI